MEWSELIKKMKEPWSQNRFIYWLSVLLSPLLARKMTCRKCGKLICRGFILFFGGRAYVCSKDRARVRYCPEGPFTLAFECVGGCPTERGLVESRIPTNPVETRVLHLVLGHQPKQYLESYFDHHRKLAAQYTHLLVFGGTRSLFDEISVANKVFCSDPSLRGPTHLQSYSQVFMLANHWIREQELDGMLDWVFFSESDLWVLQRHYVSPLCSEMEAQNADFGGVGFDDVTCTNDTHLHRAIIDGHLTKAVAHVSGAKPLRYFHMLGACLMIRWPAFKEFCERDHQDAGCFAEIYIPTTLTELGFSGVNLLALPTPLAHVRYKPRFLPEEARDLQKMGVGFVHPLKNQL